MAAPLKPILLLGHSGLVGRALLAEEPGLAVFSGQRAEFDLGMACQHIRNALKSKNPAIVINCIAMAQVDECLRRPDAAWLVNCAGVARLAMACAELRVRLIHLSTDYVFDGTACCPYREHDPVNPLNAYGKSKLAGELAVLLHHPGALVVRTSWVFGAAREGWLERPWRQCQAGQSVRVVDDQQSCPTWAPDLARALLFLAGSGVHGVIHVAGQGHATRLEACRYFFHLAGLDPQLIQAAQSSDFPAADRRPAFSALACKRLAGLGYNMPPWRESMARHWQALGTG